MVPRVAASPREEKEHPVRDLFSFRGELPRGRWLRQFLWAFAMAMAAHTAATNNAASRAAVWAPHLAILLMLFLAAATVAGSWVMLASTAKRARYFGRSPWGSLMLFLPVFGWMLALIYYGQADETALRAQT